MLTIGDRVRVHARVEMFYKDKERKASRQKHDAQAWIVGKTRRQVGTYYAGHPVFRFGDGEDYEPPCLQVTRTIAVYQVREKMNGKIYDVLPGDFTLLDRAIPESVVQGLQECRLG